MKLVVAEVEGRVDRLKGLKVNVHLLLFALISHNCTTVYDLKNSKISFEMKNCVSELSGQDKYFAAGKKLRKV